MNLKSRHWEGSGEATMIDTISSGSIESMSAYSCLNKSLTNWVGFSIIGEHKR